MLAFGMNEYCMIYVTVIDASKNKKVYYKKSFGDILRKHSSELHGSPCII